jgi:hypothetical protein
MMSIDVLIAVNNDIARKAARQRLVPYVPASADEVQSPWFCPNIGSLQPKGWEKTGQTWFVDKTGHGLDWEPALTWAQFRRRLGGYILRHPSHGYAIVEEGEFQCAVAAFRRVGSA